MHIYFFLFSHKRTCKLLKMNGKCDNEMTLYGNNVLYFEFIQGISSIEKTFY